MKIYRLFRCYVGIPENKQPQIGWLVGADGLGWTFIPADKNKEARWARAYDDCLPWWAGGIDGTRTEIACDAGAILEAHTDAAKVGFTMASIAAKMKG